jgi:hypothetical protein
MEAIRKIMRVKDNTLTVTLPDNYNDKEVELIILPAEDHLQVSEEPVDYFSKYYGSMKTNMSVEEIDQKLKELREEWNRDIL